MHLKANPRQKQSVPNEPNPAFDSHILSNTIVVNPFWKPLPYEKGLPPCSLSQLALGPVPSSYGSNATAKGIL